MGGDWQLTAVAKKAEDSITCSKRNERVPKISGQKKACGFACEICHFRGSGIVLMLALYLVPNQSGFYVLQRSLLEVEDSETVLTTTYDETVSITV